jgi:adenylate cyclase
MLIKVITSKWLILATLVLLLVFRLVDPKFTETLRLQSFDYIISTQQRVDSEEIISIDLGEASMEQHGQWPWPRQDIAQLVEKIRENGAAAIILAMFFPEPDRMGGDQQLAEAFGPDVIIAQTGTNRPKVTNGRHVGSAQLGENPQPYLNRWPGLIRSIDDLERTAGGVGMVAIAPEVDGIVRRMPLLVTVGNEIYPNLNLETLRLLAGDRSYQVNTSEAGIEWVRIPKFGRIVTDSRSRVWIPYNSNIPAIDPATSDLSAVNGKVVIVGLTAEGLNNLIPTPHGLDYPHHIQAHALQGLISGTSIQRPWWSDSAELLISLIIGLLLFFFVPKTSVKYSIPLLAGSLAVIFGSTWYAWSSNLMLLDATFPTILTILLFLHGFYVNFATEFRLKQQIKKQFGSYVSPVVVERLQKNPDLIKLGGETRELSIVMTDLRGFTTLGESFGDNVAGLTQIMNDYMTAISEPVMVNDGCIIKFIGDASLHIHNAPLDDNEHALTAVRTGLQMIEAVEMFNKSLDEQGKPRIGMGVGVNTGPTLVGNIGSKSKFGYDVLGDSVSTAARLEGQSKPYHVLIVIGSKTYEYVKDVYVCPQLDYLAVKGKTEGLYVYTVLSNDNEEKLQEWRDIVYNQHAAFLESYRNRKWNLAKQRAEKLKGFFDGMLDEYYDMMIERIEDYKINDPGKGWDGIYRSQTK